MKKFVLFVVAIVAISFASCSNKAKEEAEQKRIQDSIAAVEAEAAAAAEAAAKLEAAADSLVQNADSLVQEVVK